MGCDYFIYTYLEIKHKNGICYIELDNKRGWYCDCLEPIMDSDDEEENYIKNNANYLELFLKPSFEPIMIFDGGVFLKHRYMEKYINIIKQKSKGLLNCYRDEGKLIDINHIEQIRKIEIRQEH